MSTIASLRILLGLDSGDVAKGAGRVRGELRGVQVEANRSRDALRGVAAGFGLGAGLGTFQVASRVVSEFTDLIGDSVKAAIAEEAGIKRLDQSLRANIVGWDGNTAAIERTIAARQALGFADDEQRDALARALAATNDVAQAQNILATAMDLARFKGIDLASATDALIKVEAGQFRALKALGIELKAGATQTEALAAVQKVAAGQAEEFAGTTAGAMAEAGIAVENLKEEFGAVLMPVIKDAAEFLTNDLIPTIRDVADGAGALGKAFGDAIGPVNDLRIALDVEWPDFIPFVGTIVSLKKAAEDATGTGRGFGGSWEDAGAAAAGAAGGIDLSAAALLAQREAALDAAAAQAELKKWTDLAGDGAAEANNNLLDFASGANTAANEATAAANAARELQDELAAIERNIEINIAYKIATAPFINPRAAPGTADANRQNAFDSGGDADALDQANQNFLLRDRLAKEAAAREHAIRNEAAADANRRASDAKRIAEDAARQAERDTADAKRAQQEAWRDAQQAADQYFDRVHDQNRRAIDDIRDRRNAELDAANAAIQGAVDAEREKLNAIRDREREQELRGAVSAAETPEDLVSAQRDLQRFLQDQRVDFLQGRADAEIALNEAARENANAAADMAIAAEALRDIAARERFDPRVRTNADGTVASVNLADFENDAPIVIQLFVDGEQITEVVDRRLNARRSARTPTSASTGSMQ